MNTQWHAWFVPPRIDARTAKQIGALSVAYKSVAWTPYPILPGVEAYALPITPVDIDYALTRMLSTLVDVNVDYLKRYPMPPLYSSGVRYIGEQVGQEEWLAAPWVQARGGADCEDLCAWRVAELRIAGERANCVWSKHVSADSILYHIRVKRGNGSIEDPSLNLGMGQGF